MPLSPSTTDELIVEEQDRIAVFTLNRPERLNAISRPMLNELSAKMAQVEKDMAAIRAKKAARKEQLDKTLTEQG